MKFLHKIAAPVAALALGASLLTTPVSDAQEPSYRIRDKSDITDSSPTWRQETKDNNRVIHMEVKSESMERYIPVAVITPNGKFDDKRPTLYMLNGAGGAEQNLDWISSSPIVDFYADKNVNVVIPMEGAFSYYINWYDESPNTGTGYLTGKQLWETFLIDELPKIIEPRINATDKRGIGGYSMSATSSLLLAQKAETGFFDAAGSFSGCAETASPLGYLSAGLTVDRAGATTEQMFGPMGSEHNVANDALINAEGLRGTELYISNATGLAGEWDMPSHYINQGYDPAEASAGAGVLIVEGGVIEAATNVCTHNLKAKLDSLDIPADWNLRPTGTHSWNYWIDDLEKSWPTFERALY